MTRLFILSSVILSFLLTSLGQSYRHVELESAKIQLESLQKQIWRIEDAGASKEKSEIERLDKEAKTKDEFETTEQFETRRSKTFDRISAVIDEVRNEVEQNRNVVLRQINKILRKEFTGNFYITLGQYDADRQVFPLRLQNGNYRLLNVPLSDARIFKENFSEAEVSASVGLILDERNDAKEYLINTRISFRGKMYQSINDALTISNAMRLAFGNYNEIAKTSSWTTRVKHAALYASDDWETDVMVEVKASPLGLRNFVESGTEKAVLFSKTKSHFGENSDCRICGQIFSYATFLKSENKWKLESVVKDGGERGGWGDLSAPSLIKIGNDKYALSFGAGGMNQGYASFGYYYLEIMDGYLQEILRVSTDSDNSGAVGISSKDYEVSRSKIEFIKGNNPDYFDILVTTTGKRATKIGTRLVPRPFSQIKRYSYINGEYQLTK